MEKGGQTMSGSLHITLYTFFTSVFYFKIFFFLRKKLITYKIKYRGKKQRKKVCAQGHGNLLGPRSEEAVSVSLGPFYQHFVGII